MLTDDDAQALNDLDGMFPGSRFHTWTAGEPTNRFDSQQAAAAAATVVWLTHRGEHDDELTIELAHIGDAGMHRRAEQVDQYVQWTATGWQHLPDHDPYASEAAAAGALTPPDWLG